MAITLRTKQVLICMLVLLTLLAIIVFLMAAYGSFSHLAWGSLGSLPVAVQSWGPHSIAYQNYGP